MHLRFRNEIEFIHHGYGLEADAEPEMTKRRAAGKSAVVFIWTLDKFQVG